MSPGSLSAIIRNFKSYSAREIHRSFADIGGSVWQPNYYDQIIHSEGSLPKIRQYIRDNPKNWERDPENIRTAKKD